MKKLIVVLTIMCAPHALYAEGATFKAYFGPVTEIINDIDSKSSNEIGFALQEYLKNSPNNAGVFIDVTDKVGRFFTSSSETSSPNASQGGPQISVSWSLGIDIPKSLMTCDFFMGKACPVNPAKYRLVILQTLGGLFENVDWLQGNGQLFESMVDAFKRWLGTKGIIPNKLPTAVGKVGEALHWEYDSKAESSGHH
jgi:hypothetical protein